MAKKRAELPTLPWYGYALDATGSTSEASDVGVWTAGPSRILSHAGFLLQFHGGHGAGCGPLRFTYLRPGASLWRAAEAPFATCCVGGALDTGCLPAWLRAAMGNETVLHAPGVLYDPNGQLPDRTGERTRHFSIYYSTAAATATRGLACIGRVSGRWLGEDATCAPTVEWEDDGFPVVCSNTLNSTEVGGESVADVDAGARFDAVATWREAPGTGGEALAHGAEPFYAHDGSLYLVYGVREPGNVRVVQLNESSARLPRAAQPGQMNISQAVLFHEVARGPSFVLGADARAPHLMARAYIGGKVAPQPDTSSLVGNAFVHLIVRNGTRADYFLFVEWFGGGDGATGGNESFSRIYVGRSRGSPLGPYYDRIGNDMNKRSSLVLGDQRTISIVSALWGHNCDQQGYDVAAVARLKCEGRPTCEWVMRYQELLPIDPLSYQDYDFPPSMQTVADRHSDTPNNYADNPGCPRAMNITYRCTKGTDVLYEGEILDEELYVHVPGEAANGSVASLRCDTPQPVRVPGGSLFADAQRLGGDLHFRTIGHPAVFSYQRASKESVHVFTFQYHTSRSPVAEMGARRIRFAADGWPILAEDFTAQWATCGVPEATYDHQAPAEYHEREAHYDPRYAHQAHYSSSTSTLTHCRHHKDRGSHCVGNSLRATHPAIGAPGGVEGDLLHGTINEEGTTAYWREQADQCNPLVASQLGRPLKCTRFAGKGDINASGHITTMERIRGCPRLMCEKKWTCKPDTRTRAAAGTEDTCTDGMECKKLIELRVVPWDSSDFFNLGGRPIVLTRDGLGVSTVAPVAHCHAAPHVSRIDPALGVVGGGTLVTVYGTGFGAPARCRFGWLETPAENVTAHLMLCRAPALNDTFSSSRFMHSTPLSSLLRYSWNLEVSMMETRVLEGTPLTDAAREDRGQNFTRDHVRFHYHDPADIAICFLRPSGGPTAGGTRIDVHGTGFWPNDANSNLRCRFSWTTEEVLPYHAGEPPIIATHTERVVMQASYHNDERISCISPNRTSNAPARLDISLNEQEYHADNVTFTYFTLHDVYDPAPPGVPPVTTAVSAIHPVGGPARGGTIVTLFGSGFAPLDDPGNHLEAPRNRELRTSDDDDMFALPRRSLLSRLGLFCLFDGVDIVLHGARQSIDPLETRTSLIAGTIVRAAHFTGHQLSNDVMTCVVPAHEKLQTGELGDGPDANVSLEITLNGNPQEKTASGLRYTYYREEPVSLPKLHAVHPFGGPADGGTPVTIHGSRLRSLVGLGTPLCRFGVSDENTTVPATILPSSRAGEQRVVCVAPPLPERHERPRRDVPLSVAMNGLDYVRRALRFAYYPLDKLFVQRLEPRGGPVDGGTLVLLAGRKIGSTRGGLHCRFGGAWVAATAVTDDSVRCVSPPWRNYSANVSSYPWGFAAVHVTVNDDVQHSAVSLSSQPFTYFAPQPVLSVSSIYPRAGGSEGGNAITLTGRGFRELGGVYCRFGVAPPVMAEATPPPPSPRPAPGKDGEVRLANGGPSGLQGRVEVYHDGEWGTVCDDFWDLDDAATVCKQLGFFGAANASLRGAFGPGDGPIWLDNVHCASGETRLDRCGHHGWGVHDCDHHEDAGVVCVDEPSQPAGPPPPGAPWTRLDDFALMRHAAGAHLSTEAPRELLHLRQLSNDTEFGAFVCRSPSLTAALGGYDHRAVVKAVPLRVSLDGQLYGEPISYTYYPL